MAESERQSVFPTPEQISNASAIGIFIEDESKILKGWLDCFGQVKDFLPIPVTDESSVRQTIKTLYETGWDKVILVVADQFRMEDTMHDYAKALLYLIKDGNPSAWMVETSFAPDETAYGSIGTHATFNLGDEEDRTVQTKFLEQYSHHPNQPLITILKNTLNEEFLVAERAGKDIYNPHLYIDRLTENGFFYDLLKLLGLDKETFMNKYDDSEKQSDVLHEAFRILGHLKAGSDENYYGMALTRLMNDLGIVNTLS